MSLLGPSLLLAGTLQAAAPEPERLVYRWRIEGLSGWIGGAFFPTRGEGHLVREPLPNGNVRTELLITSRERSSEDFFRYAAEYEPDSLAAVRAWSSSRWRGEQRSRQVEVKQPGVIDLVSGIEWIRRNRPQNAVERLIWSDGKLYPVEIRRLPETRSGSERVESYAVRGLERPGERFWKGRLELKLRRDPDATPVEIVVQRSVGRVRLELVKAEVEDA